MSVQTITTQTQLESALADTDVTTIYIESTDGVWLHIGDHTNKHVVARGSSHVVAWGSSHVEAGSFVAVHLHSGRAEVSGGVLIDLTQIDESQPATWCSYRGAALDGDDVVLFKAVRGDLRSARGFAYPIGETVRCDDFTDVDECGGGLHLSPTASQAFSYDADATRFLECRVPLAELRPITGGMAKAKARQVRVVREVDRYGKPLAVKTVQA